MLAISNRVAIAEAPERVTTGKMVTAALVSDLGAARKKLSRRGVVAVAARQHVVLAAMAVESFRAWSYRRKIARSQRGLAAEETMTKRGAKRESCCCRPRHRSSPRDPTAAWMAQDIHQSAPDDSSKVVE